MKPLYNNVLKIIALVIAVIIAVIATLGFWLYKGVLTPAKIKTFSLLPFPMAIINGHSIPVSKFILRCNITKKMFVSGGTSTTDAETRKAIIAQLISEEKVLVVAQNKGVSVSPKELDADYEQKAKNSPLEGKKSFDDLVNSYGMSPSIYKSEIIKPQILLNNLQVWFNSQQDLNKAQYSLANDIVQRIKKGDNMVILAVGFSQQDADKSTGGDLGFVNTADLLPELKEQVESMSVGETKIIPSRYGLHIIRLEDKKDNLLHLRQIFLNGEDFQAWYNNEIKKFKITQLIKI